MNIKSNTLIIISSFRKQKIDLQICKKGENTHKFNILSFSSKINQLQPQISIPHAELSRSQQIFTQKTKSNQKSTRKLIPNKNEMNKTPSQNRKIRFDLIEFHLLTNKINPRQTEKRPDSDKKERKSKGKIGENLPVN